MSAVSIDWNPDRRKLREFGFVSLAAFALIGSVIAWRSGCFKGSGHWTAPIIAWSLGVWGLLGAFAPVLVKPLYTGLMAIAFPIGWVVSHVLLGLVYYGIFTPTALVFRLLGRDPLQRKLDRAASTYWNDAVPCPPPAGYFRQF